MVKGDKNAGRVKGLIPSLLAVLCMLFLFSCTPPGSRREGGRIFAGSGEDIVRTARQYLGVPYVHGGADPSGFDCSGYVMYVYRENGISLPRSTTAQYGGGRSISLDDAGPGDLLFFRTSGFHVSHVAIHTGGGRFIHAPSAGKSISFSSLDNPYWRRRFAGAVTYLREHSRPSRREWVH